MGIRDRDPAARRRLWLLLAALAVAVAVVAAGCGGGGEEGAAPAETTAAETTPAETGAPAEVTTAEQAAPAEGEPIKLGILSDCEGAYGAFFEQDIAGAQLPLIARGATPKGNPSDGLDGAVVAGRPIEIVGYGCSNDTPEKAIEETRRLVEQLGAEILIGPLSGDEGIAVANYSKEHPETTFINGTSGAQDTTLKVQSPNFFRFNADGAQWSAGLADYAYNVLGWRDAVTVADDYSFSYTSAAGFIAEFCALGGKITKRIWPPLNSADYTSFVAQLSPDDNVLAAIGGNPLAFLKAYEDIVGPIDPTKMVGNLFYGDPSLLPEFAGRTVGMAFADHSFPDSQDPKAQEYFALVDETYPDPPVAGTGASVWVYNYYNAAEAMAQALEATNGVLEEDGQASFREALANVVLDAPFGEISLDENRQAIQDNYLKVVTENGGVTFWKIPQVTEDFGGTFTADTPAPDRDNPVCGGERELPWVGNEEIVGQFPTEVADSLGLSPEAKQLVGAG